MSIKTHNLLSAVLVTGVSEVAEPIGLNKVFQASGFVTASTGSATIVIQGSVDGTNYETLDTLSLSLVTSVVTDFGVNTAAWPFIRANVSAISGTNAQVTLDMSNEV